MKINIKEYFLNIATLGPIGRLPLGEYLAACLAFPLLFVLGWIYALSSSFFYIIIALTFILALIAAYIALSIETPEDPKVIVVGNLLGMLTVFASIPLTIKFAAIGILLFYVTRYFFPLVMRKFMGDAFERWPLIVTMLGVNIASGLVVNVFLQFILWLTN